jgi:hypothetical protein
MRILEREISGKWELLPETAASIASEADANAAWIVFADNPIGPGRAYSYKHVSRF